MTTKQRDRITQISKDFAAGFAHTIGTIAGSGYLIADPLSDYLGFAGFEHSVGQMPATDHHPQVLILEFPDGDTFIPAGSDLKSLAEGFHDWMWLPVAV